MNVVSFFILHLHFYNETIYTTKGHGYSPTLSRLLQLVLVFYYQLSNTSLSSITLIKPYDKLVLLMFICTWTCFYEDQRGQRFGKCLLVIYFLFYIVLCINWFLNLHIYISGKLMARYFFYAGFSALQGRFTMAAPADLGASIHILGVS